MKLSELADQLNCTLRGDDCDVNGVADINQAGSGDLAYISSEKYKKFLSVTKASAIISKEEWLMDCELPVLITEDPRLAFAKAASLFNPVKSKTAGIHPSASIAEDALIHASAVISANVVIEAGATVSADAVIDAGTVIGENVIIGKATQLNANVTIYHGCTIGENCILHSGVVIGADGFGFVREGDSYFKVPQLGKVHIGNDVEIGANTCVDRGALLDTVISDGVKLDNLIQIGHNVEIGEHTVISAASAVAGTVKIGKNCLIGGNVGIRDNIEIADNVIITGRTLVSRSIKKPGSYSSSTPIDDTLSWRKNAARFRQLDDMAKRLIKLEKEKQ